MKLKILALFVFMLLFLNVLSAFAEKFKYDSKGKRSPFSPPGFVPETGTTGDISELDIPLQVTGIIWDDNNPFAMINDKIVKKGDMVSGALVSDIKKDEVILKINDKKFVLKIKERKAMT